MMQEIELNASPRINVDVSQQVINVDVYTTGQNNLEIATRGFVAPVTKFEQYAYQLTATDIEEKKVYIVGEYAPQGNFVKFQPRGAPCVIITLDFIFNSEENSISWDGLGLDGLLEEDEWVEITYSYFYH